MKVFELIQALGTLPPDAELVVNYDHGVIYDLTEDRIIVQRRDTGTVIHLCAMKDSGVAYVAEKMKSAHVYGKQAT